MEENSVGLDPSSEMEAAPYSPSPNEQTSTEPMRPSTTDLPPKRPLEDESSNILYGDVPAPEPSRLRPTKRILRRSPRSGAHPASASRTWNVFVGDLRSEVTETDLLRAFTGCGPISSVHIVRDAVTGQQRGFGFIHFTSAEAQLNALKEPYARQLIRGRAVRVCISDEKNTLQLHELAADWSAEELEREITQLVPHVQSVEIRKRAFEPMSAIVTFTNHDSGDKARRILAKTVLRGRRLAVTWAETGTTRVTEPVTRRASYPLYIWNLHATVDATLLRALFLQFMNEPSDHVGLCTCLGEGRAVLEVSSAFMRARALKALANIKFRGCALYLATSPPASSWPVRANYGNHTVNTPPFTEPNFAVNSPAPVNISAPASPHRTASRHPRPRLDVGHEPPDISGLSTRPTKRARAPDPNSPAPIPVPHVYHTPPPLTAPQFPPPTFVSPPLALVVPSFVPLLGYQPFAHVSGPFYFAPSPLYAPYYTNYSTHAPTTQFEPHHVTNHVPANHVPQFDTRVNQFSPHHLDATQTHPHDATAFSLDTTSASLAGPAVSEPHPADTNSEPH